MNRALKKAYFVEINKAKDLYNKRFYDQSFKNLERAHILGQQSLLPHLETHWWMFKIGVKQSNNKEIFGQALRIFACFPGYLLGWVPKGNTGGANISAVKPMPIPEEFSDLLKSYSVWRDVAIRLTILISILSAYFLVK
ncbi:hypothetical protein BALOs_0614 [Halobacteriovorax sp. BALOs_7]|uniref:DUF3703 domain-containing protein n=1 Tax=Halobacteriovorax sp. BALOs_7 TaxID=2109558 RepID=UPI000EA35945|nr:DUF3703 domain-containing protein [Halobacteriovorax sp. BALOs_7]AYF43626.1 hypothetical protein BALOs_0614 [Halobacteriovorax sp. BALOs_7]